MTEGLKDENELVKKAKDGDRTAFDALVKNCARDIYNLCLRLSGNKAAAEDIAQDAFISAYKNMARFEQKGAFGGWVYRIAVNAWKNRVRYEKRRFFFKHDSLDEAMETEDGQMQRQLPGDGPAPDSDIERGQKSERIRKALSELGAEAKEMIVLRDMEELSYEEISGMTGLPLGTVKSRIARAREALRVKLQDLIRDAEIPGRIDDE
jgi:RNA polymerase sigma-70 factor (ECF subfamily)